MAEAKAKTAKSERYIESVGRRKTAIARVRMTPAAKMAYTVNDREFDVYFPTEELRSLVASPFEKGKIADKFKITAKIVGGGVHSQAEAMRHGIARALVILDGENRKKIKKAGLLERDSRAKERRKFGLKKARKAPQWSKR